MRKRERDSLWWDPTVAATQTVYETTAIIHILKKVVRIMTCFSAFFCHWCWVCQTLYLGNCWSLSHMMSTSMSEGRHCEKWGTLKSGSVENYGGQWHLNRLYICDTGQQSMRETLSDLWQRDIKQMWGQRSTALCGDATLIRDPCRSQVSCYYIHVFMGPCIGQSWERWLELH